MLFDMVCEHLNLLEKDYFGLTFCDSDSQKVSTGGSSAATPSKVGAPLTCCLLIAELAGPLQGDQEADPQ